MFRCVGHRDAAEDDGGDDDLIHMGHAIMTFYAALIDLLGRCAPEMHVRYKSEQRRESLAAQ